MKNFCKKYFALLITIVVITFKRNQFNVFAVTESNMKNNIKFNDAEPSHFLYNNQQLSGSSKQIKHRRDIPMHLRHSTYARSSYYNQFPSNYRTIRTLLKKNFNEESLKSNQILNLQKKDYSQQGEYGIVQHIDKQLMNHSHNIRREIKDYSNDNKIISKQYLTPKAQVDENDAENVPGEEKKSLLNDGLLDNNAHSANIISTQEVKTRNFENSSLSTPEEAKIDKDTLREAFDLMNIGKKTLGLDTENTEYLMELVDNPKNKSLFQKIIDEPFNSKRPSLGEQYLRLSGNKHEIHIDNFTNVTTGEIKGKKIHEVFRFDLTKKIPYRTGTVLRTISVVEKDEQRPVDVNNLVRRSVPIKQIFDSDNNGQGKYLVQTSNKSVHQRLRRKRNQRYDSKLNTYKAIARSSKNEINPDENTSSTLEENLNNITDVFLRKHNQSNIVLNVTKATIKIGDKTTENIYNITENTSSHIQPEIYNSSIANSVLAISVLKENEIRIPKVIEVAKNIKNSTDLKVLHEENVPVNYKPYFREQIQFGIFEIASLISIGLLCFITGLIVYSKFGRRHNDDLDLRGANVTLKLDDVYHESFFKRRWHHFKEPKYQYLPQSPSKEYDDLMREDDENLVDLEWQSELGDWTT